MPNNNNDDLIAGLIGAGMVAAAGYVGYKVFKAVTDRNQEALASPTRPPVVATSYTSRYEPSSTSNDNDYYPDYEGEDLEDAED